MNRQERFSLRKYKFGVASVLLGAVLVFGSAQASAEEQAASQTKCWNTACSHYSTGTC